MKKEFNIGQTVKIFNEGSQCFNTEFGKVDKIEPDYITIIVKSGKMTRKLKVKPEFVYP